MPSSGKDMEKLEPSYSADGTVKWGSCCGKLFGSFSGLLHDFTYMWNLMNKIN